MVDTTSKDATNELFDRWLNFADAQLEEKFRAFSFEESRRKMLIILSFSIAILCAAVVISIIFFFAGALELFNLEIRISVLLFFGLAWFYCRTTLWCPWHFHFLVVGVVVLTLTRMVGAGGNPFFIMMAPMARAITCTSSMHKFSLSVVFNSLDIIMLLVGGHIIWPSLAVDLVFFAPFVVVYIAGLYLQFYVERMDRLHWNAELGLQAQVVAENKLRMNTETMLRFISHEVRNPQNAIALSADSLLMEAHENPDTFLPDHIRIFEIVRSSSEFITALLEGLDADGVYFSVVDVLNFHRLNDGKVALTMQPFCPMEFLTHMANSLSIVLGSKNLEFLTHVDPRLASFFCSGDKHRIQQVVSNFVSNAAKFTAAGGQVKMTALLCQPEETPQPPSVSSWVRIRIGVKDSGIGISEADQKLLFQTFSQINPAKNQGGKGMGLGLNISKGLVELHGGQIGVISVEGEGAEFFCEIPFCVVDEPESVCVEQSSAISSSDVGKVNSPSSHTYSAKRSAITAHMISPANGVHNPITPSSAVRALPVAPDAHVTMQRLIEEAEVELSERRVPVVVSVVAADIVPEVAPMLVIQGDIGLSNNARGVEDVLSPSRCSGGDSGGRLEPPGVIFHSAAVSGVSSTLHPVQQGARISRRLPAPSHAAVVVVSNGGGVNAFNSRSRGVNDKSPSNSVSVCLSARPQRLERVLAADDQKFVRDILERLLKQLGFDCVMVASGEDAIAAVKADIAAFNLIFLDMNMGGISGVDTTIELRRLGCTAIIIGLTGDDSSECHEQFLHATAERVLTKPLRLQKLNEALLDLMPPSPNFPPVIAASPRPCIGLKLNASTDSMPAYVASSAYTPLHGLVSSAKAATPSTAVGMRRAASHRHSVGSLDGSTVIDIFPNIRITTPAVDHSPVFVFPDKA